jgi:hypothetical protein
MTRCANYPCILQQALPNRFSGSQFGPRPKNQQYYSRNHRKSLKSRREQISLSFVNTPISYFWWKTGLKSQIVRLFRTFYTTYCAMVIAMHQGSCAPRAVQSGCGIVQGAVSCRRQPNRRMPRASTAPPHREGKSAGQTLPLLLPLAPTQPHTRLPPVIEYSPTSINQGEKGRQRWGGGATSGAHKLCLL